MTNSQGTNERLIERLLVLRMWLRTRNDADADIVNEAMDALATKWEQEPEQPSVVVTIPRHAIELARSVRDGYDNPTAARIVALSLLDVAERHCERSSP